MAPRLNTQIGPRQHAPRPHIVFPTDRVAALTLAGRLDRLADHNLHLGFHLAAERLARQAAEMREVGQ